MKLFGIQVVPDGARWPRIVTHLLDHESTTVTFGFWLFIVASFAAFFVAGDRKLDASDWLWCVILSSILIGGVKVGKSMLEAMALKLGGGKPSDVKEEKTDDPAPQP